MSAIMRPRWLPSPVVRSSSSPNCWATRLRRPRTTALCEAIAVTEYGLTANIGFASTPARSPMDFTDSHALVEHLVDRADTAMYRKTRPRTPSPVGHPHRACTRAGTAR